MFYIREESILNLHPKLPTMPELAQKLVFPNLQVNVSDFYSYYKQPSFKRLVFQFNITGINSIIKPSPVTLICYAMNKTDGVMHETPIPVSLIKPLVIHKLKSKVNLGNLDMPKREIDSFERLNSGDKFLLVPDQYDDYVFYHLFLNEISGHIQDHVINPCPPRCA